MCKCWYRPGTAKPNLNQVQVEYWEQASNCFDTSQLKLDELTLSEDWLAKPMKEDLRVKFFSQEDFPHQRKEDTDPEVLQRMDAIEQVLTNLNYLKQGKIPDGFSSTDMAELLRKLPDPKAFQAGQWSVYGAVWDKLLGPYRRERKNVKEVLTYIKTGAKWPLVVPTSQTDMPDFKHKLARLTNMLSRAETDHSPTEILDSATPKAVKFPNHASVDRHPEFVSKAIGEAQVARAVWELPEGWRPQVCNSLGVASKAEKLRMVVDPAYPNLLFKYLPLRYEQLSDLMTYILNTDWVTTTDEKSGYHHMALDPEIWTLLGFYWEGKYYVFTHMPFGVGPACRAYTTIKQELYRVLRDLGNIRMTFLIDDQINAAATKELALFQVYTIVLMKWALGFTLSVPKCIFEPTKLAPFLGMMVDIENLRFLLPEQKVAEFQTLVGNLGMEATKRQLARVAGKLISYAPAVGLSKLYAQVLYKVMKGQFEWDVLYPTPMELVQTLKWVAEKLPEWNGLPWTVERETLVVAGDYGSNTGYGAYTPYGELADPIVVSLTPEEEDLIARNKFSSTYGELRALDLTLETLVRHRPEMVQGKTLHYEGDNQAAMTIVNGMKGNDRNFPLVKKIWELAKAHDVHITCEWHPREASNQQMADHFSKIRDNSQWGLNDTVYTQYIAGNQLVMQKGGITIDLFADHLTAKVPRFRSRYWCPGTLGVDAFKHPMAYDPVTKKRELGYANTDFSRIGELLAKIKQEQADVVIVYPDWPRYWKALLAALPVRADFCLPRRKDLCVPGPRVHPGKKRGQAPNYSLRCAIVLW